MRSVQVFVSVLSTILLSGPLTGSFQINSLPKWRPMITEDPRPFVAASISSDMPSNPTDSSVSVDDLRAIQVTDVNGRRVTLGSAMSDGTSVLVFLRHLGCTWCWSYVYQWKLAQKEVSDAGINGPIFVSIGDKDRLNAFLLTNPEIAAENFFVDGYDFEAYKKAGFGRFDEKPKEITDNVKPKPAKLGGIQGWWTFLTNFMQLAPVTPDMKFPENLTPEGLFWVGGTIVIKGDEIVYRWDDRISGDHPEASEIVEIAKKTVAA